MSLFPKTNSRISALDLRVVLSAPKHVSFQFLCRSVKAELSARCRKLLGFASSRACSTFVRGGISIVQGDVAAQLHSVNFIKRKSFKKNKTLDISVFRCGFCNGSSSHCDSACFYVIQANERREVDVLDVRALRLDITVVVNFSLSAHI